MQPCSNGAAEETVKQVKDAQQAALVIVIGMSTSPARGGQLPAIRSRFSLTHPAASLTLRQVNWGDATAGLADGSSDVAFVWLPLPSPERYEWILVPEEASMVAMPERHQLPCQAGVDFSALLDEPFLALPKSAGSLRDY